MVDFQSIVLPPEPKDGQSSSCTSKGAGAGSLLAWQEPFSGPDDAASDVAVGLVLRKVCLLPAVDGVGF